MKNWIVISLFWAGMFSCLYGVRATPYPIEVVQPDGSKLTIRLVGDERFAYTTTSDGYVVKKDRDGFYRYTPPAVSVLPANQMPIAKNKEDRSEKDLRVLKNLSIHEQGYLPEKKSGLKDKLSAEQQRGLKRLMGKEVSTKSVGSEKPVKYLVILASFSDKPMIHSQKDFHDLLNKKDYSSNGGTGSVRDYYMESSMGQFAPVFDVVGPVVLPKTSYYYGHDDNELDPNAPEMIKEACLTAKAQNPMLNFADYDIDGDKIVDNVYVIFAGYSQAGSGNEDLVWPHAFSLEPKLTIDGVQVFKYACSSELVGYEGNKIDGVGTFAHEFGHVIGLLDMYDTDGYNGGLAFDPGPYSIMASGSYNNESRTPPTLSSIERLILGWGNVEVMKGPQDVVLPDLLSSNKGYAIDTYPMAEGLPMLNMERFYIENRQQKGWDTYLPGHGLLIFHVDMSPAAIEKYFMSNSVNSNARHRCIYIKSADGKDSETTRAGDPYPGTSGNTAFTDTSIPAAISWSGLPSKAPITNIREDEGVIRFQFMGGVEKLPEVRTYKAQQISNKSAILKGEVISNGTQIAEQGFCWANHAKPTVADSKIALSVGSKDLNHPLSGLTPFTKYFVRTYARYEDDLLAYGPVLSFWTDCDTYSAPYMTGFTNWSDNTPDCWLIVDANNDGITWSLDEMTGAASYMASMADPANDWLISPRIKVPANGSLTYIRGLIEERAVEQMEVWISTQSRNLSDFIKVDSRSLDDNYFMQQPEGVDISAFSGKEVYIALVAKSERASYGIWLMGAYVTSKLDPVKLISLQPACDGLFAKWEPVEGAKNYFTEVWAESSKKDTIMTILNETHFLPAPEGVSIASASVIFRKSAVISTILFPEPILGFGFISEGSGPSGISSVRVEGSADGSSWSRLGPDIKIEKSLEQTQNILSNYIYGKGYRQLRFSCTHGGRNVKMTGSTIVYTNGYQKEYLNTSSDTTGIMTHKVISGLTPGKKYTIAVYASDKMLYYDAANTLSQTAPASITSSTYKGENGGSWNHPDNWDCLPCKSTHVIIPAGKNVVIPVRDQAQYNTLTLEANDKESASLSVYGSAPQKKITLKRKFDKANLLSTMALPFSATLSSATDELGNKIAAGTDIEFYDLNPATGQLQPYSAGNSIGANKALFVKPLREMTMTLPGSALGANPSYTKKSVSTVAGWSFNGVPTLASVVLNPGYQSHGQENHVVYQYDNESQVYRTYTLGDGKELKSLTPIVTYNQQPSVFSISPGADYTTSYPSRYGWFPFSLISKAGHDNTVLALYQEGSDGKDKWDAKKLFSPATDAAELYSEVEGVSIAINSLQYESSKTTALHLSSGKHTELTLSFDRLSAVGEIFSLTLKDLFTNKIHDLLLSDYPFQTTTYTKGKRFELTIESKASSLSTESVPTIFVDRQGGDLIIKGTAEGDAVRVFSLMGQLLNITKANGGDVHLEGVADQHFLLLQITNREGKTTTLKYKK